MAVERLNKKPNSLGEDEKKVLQVMLGQFNNEKNQPTFDLLGRSSKNSPSASSSSVEFDLLELGQEQCLPSGWEKCLDLKTGEVYYLNSEGTELSSKVFSRQKISKLTSIDEEEKLDLKLNLSTSNVLKASKKNANGNSNTDDNITEEVESAMRLVGCPTCLMYFMVPSLDLKCPKCKGSFLLDFHDGD